ncbi:thiol-disulfide oxidoreductase DCC family protein [Candidatus Mycalebacterium sp.]
MKPLPYGNPVIFFDGVCGLCNRFVRFVLKRDTRKIFFFSTLQGQTAAKTFSAPPDFHEWSIVYMDEEGVHRFSGAVIKILTRMGGGWRFVRAFEYVPAFIRDFIYGYVARRRYAWFGKFDSCVLPSAENSDRFLP